MRFLIKTIVIMALALSAILLLFLGGPLFLVLGGVALLPILIAAAIVAGIVSVVVAVGKGVFKGGAWLVRSASDSRRFADAPPKPKPAVPDPRPLYDGIVIGGYADKRDPKQP